MKLLVLIILFLYVQNNPVQALTLREGIMQAAKRVEQRESEARARRLFLERVQRVQVYLESKNSPLANYAEVLVRCSDAYGLNPGLIVGITKAESSLGLHYQLSNNPWNWGVHQGISFKSMEEGACAVARGLSKNYDLSNTYTIGKRFAPASDGNNPNHWAAVVQEVINEINL